MKRVMKVQDSFGQRYLVGIALGVALVIAILGLVWNADVRSASPPPDRDHAASSPAPTASAPTPELVPGCIIHDGLVNAVAGQATTIDVSVTYLACVPKSAPLDSNDQYNLVQLRYKYEKKDFTPADIQRIRIEADDAELEGRLDESNELLRDYAALKDIYEKQAEYKKDRDQILVGGRARLLLTDPLSNVEIKPISDEIQEIDSRPSAVGHWSWQVRPNEPGDEELSLVMSALSPGSNDVEYANARVTVLLHTTGETKYYVTSAGSGMNSLLTGLAALVVAVGGAVLTVKKIVPMVKSKKSSESSRDDSNDGYL